MVRPAEYFPALHVVQLNCATSVLYRPDEQAVQESLPVLALYRPGAQGVHEVAFSELNDPRSQMEHEDEPDKALKLPGEQAWQGRAPPTPNCPAEHTRQADAPASAPN
jgi:hypothetical protein